MPVVVAAVVVVSVVGVVGAVVLDDDVVVGNVVVFGVVAVVSGNEITKEYIDCSRCNYGYIIYLIWVKILLFFIYLPQSPQVN